MDLNVHFFLQVREFFVLHRMVGRTQRGVLTPGYCEPCNFPSTGTTLFRHLFCLGEISGHTNGLANSQALETALSQRSQKKTT